jgi:hypothetical protein
MCQLACGRWGNGTAARRFGLRCTGDRPWEYRPVDGVLHASAISRIRPAKRPPRSPDFQRLCRLYRDVAAETGRQLRLGESVGAFRAVHFGRTEEEAVALFRDTNFAGFYHYFGGFGFAEAFRLPEDAEKYPPPAMLPQSEWTVPMGPKDRG